MSKNVNLRGFPLLSWTAYTVAGDRCGEFTTPQSCDSATIVAEAHRLRFAHPSTDVVNVAIIAPRDEPNCQTVSMNHRLVTRSGDGDIRMATVNLLTLGVETSGLAGTISLRRDGQTVESITLDQSGRRHAQSLIAETAALLGRHGCIAKQLQLVAVSIGPGSFTGLRVGVVFAKALAYATGCRLVAVDSFHAIAAASPPEVSEVFVVSDAQRGDLFVGHFERNLTDSKIGNWHRTQPLSIERTDDWISWLTQRTANSTTPLSGPASETLRSKLPPTVMILGAECQSPHAAFIAELGEQMALAGELADLWSLEPVYLRRSAAEEKAATVTATR